MMTPDPLNLPLMAGRIAIASAALTHSLFATFIVGTTVMAAVVATVAHVTDHRHYRRLAHVLAFSLVLATGTISFLGVTLIFCLNIFWPRFWHTIFRVMFWPFLAEAMLFLGEAVFAYAWYYLWPWSAGSPARRQLHLSFVWLAMGCAVVAMFMIDITASYMLTPHPIDASWANVLNPTMIHLDLHRWFGNLTWTGFALAGICAIGYLRHRGAEDRQFYAWAVGVSFLIGFGALLVMPVIGYHYLLNVRYGQPQAFQTLMLGERSWLFDTVGLLYGLLLVGGSVFILKLIRVRSASTSAARIYVSLSLGILALAALALALPYHIQHIPGARFITDAQINPLGKMQPFKYLALALLVVVGFGNWLFYLRWVPRTPGEALQRPSPSLLLVLAGLSLVIMLTMGWVRETARAANGYLIFDHFALTDELPTYRGAAPAQLPPSPTRRASPD